MYYVYLCPSLHVLFHVRRVHSMAHSMTLIAAFPGRSATCLCLCSVLYVCVFWTSCLFYLPRDAMRKQGTSRQPVRPSVRQTRLMYRNAENYQKAFFILLAASF